MVGNTPTLAFCLTFGEEYETDFEFKGEKKSCEFNFNI